MYVSGLVVDDRKLTSKNVFLNLLGAWTDFGGSLMKCAIVFCEFHLQWQLLPLPRLCR